jgi:hypothetical protein
MIAKPVPIAWQQEFPIFANESFLKAVGDEYGWLGGFSESGEQRCILPYTIVQKMFFRMVRFRTETIPLGIELNIDEEKAFLDSALGYFRTRTADMIIPASNNAIFRTYPEGAAAVPYGSYVIDLSQPEEIIWRKIDRITRQNIRTAQKKEIRIQNGTEQLDAAYKLVSTTFGRSRLPFMSYEAFKRYMQGLGENGKILMADYMGDPQSYVVFAFSKYCAYAVYAGNIADQQQGANKLLYWEAIRLFRELGVQRYDFMGARIDPEKGSKQEAINLFKKRFGAELKRGYMWKYPLHPLKYRIYGLAARLRTGGDIVDKELGKLKNARD